MRLKFTFGTQEGEWNDVFLPSGVLKEELISIRYPTYGDWVGDWEHSGFLSINQNGTLFAFAKATFEGEIRGPDGEWHSGTLELVVHTKAKLSPDWSVLYMIRSQFTILRGAGELANLRGHGVEDDLGQLTAWLHFEPSN
jgi:hypothetical protein